MKKGIKNHYSRSRRTCLLIAMLAVFLSCFSAVTDQSSVYAAGSYTAPKLTKLDYKQNSANSYSATITWKSKKGAYYEILRKTSKTTWKVIGRHQAGSGKATYRNSNIGKKVYTYTVRQVSSPKSKKKKKGRFDRTGLTTMTSPKVEVDYTNLHAVVHWTKKSRAQKYIVYRKIGRNNKYKKIAVISASKTSYKDVYSRSRKDPKMSSVLLSGCFVDPSDNPVVYTVRPYYQKKVGKTVKKSYGSFLIDGDHHLEAPTIVSLSENGVLKWGTVPNADGYDVIEYKEGSSGWITIKRVKAKAGSLFQKMSIGSPDPGSYYAVVAFSHKNGKTEYSSYDPSFTLQHRNSGSNTNVLFLGDSITYGSPYYDRQKGKFSYAHRIQQLTGIRFFNPSIPGATWHYAPSRQRYRLVNSVAAMLSLGETVETAGADSTGRRFEDFDIIFLAGGTNDYMDKPGTVPGSRETDWEKIHDNTKGLEFTVNSSTDHSKTYVMDFDYNINTFDGAYNQIFKYIEEASILRVLSGRPPIKVVSVEMFFSSRTSPINKITDRNKAKNTLGYTLKDYQKEMTVLNDIWGRSPVLDVFTYQSQRMNILDKSNCSYMSADNLHLTRFTYALYANSMSDFMMQNDLFSDMSAGEIDDLVNSEPFQELLSKYENDPGFREKLNQQFSPR